MGIRHRGESKASYLGEERNTRSFTTERAGHPDGNLEGGRRMRDAPNKRASLYSLFYSSEPLILMHAHYTISRHIKRARAERQKKRVDEGKAEFAIFAKPLGTEISPPARFPHRRVPKYDLLPVILLIFSIIIIIIG